MLNPNSLPHKSVPTLSYLIVKGKDSPLKIIFYIIYNTKFLDIL